jgi:hypothetical protein
VFFFMVSMFSLTILTSSAWYKSRCVPFNLSPSWLLHLFSCNTHNIGLCTICCCQTEGLKASQWLQCHLTFFNYNRCLYIIRLIAIMATCMTSYQLSVGEQARYRSIAATAPVSLTSFRVFIFHWGRPVLRKGFLLTQVICSQTAVCLYRHACDVN